MKCEHVCVSRGLVGKHMKLCWTASIGSCWIVSGPQRVTRHYPPGVNELPDPSNYRRKQCAFFT